jgi:hypothetical protein
MMELDSLTCLNLTKPWCDILTGDVRIGDSG